MKIFYISLALISSITIFLSCATSSDNQPDNRVVIKKVDKQFILLSDKSKINWERFVDNKKVEKTIRLFGSDCKVTMENVQFNTNGTFNVGKGELLMTDDKWLSGTIELDFVAMRIWSDEEQKYFTTKEFPASVLRIDSFDDDTLGNGHYIMKCNLSILDSSKNIDIPVIINTDSLGLVNVDGNFKIQTLDWPLKETPDRANVRKDEITLNLNLYFENIKNDTSIVYQFVDSTAVK